jgi:hypothetical protein
VVKRTAGKVLLLMNCRTEMEQNENRATFLKYEWIIKDLFGARVRTLTPDWTFSRTGKTAKTPAKNA